jgi:hypothetical protein
MQTTITAPADETNKTNLGLTPEHRAELEKAGLSETEIESINVKIRAKATGKTKSKTKINIPAALEENRDALKEMSGGKPLFSGRAAGTAMIRLGKGNPVRGFNAYGDALGGHGHNLPSVSYQGRRVYDIDYIGASDEEKAARQEVLNGMPFIVIAALVADLGE